MKHKYYSKVVGLLIISIDIIIFGFYRAMKEKTDCKLLQEALRYENIPF